MAVLHQHHANILDTCSSPLLEITHPRLPDQHPSRCPNICSHPEMSPSPRDDALTSRTLTHKHYSSLNIIFSSVKSHYANKFPPTPQHRSLMNSTHGQEQAPRPEFNHNLRFISHNLFPLTFSRPQSNPSWGGEEGMQAKPAEPFNYFLNVLAAKMY